MFCFNVMNMQARWKENGNHMKLVKYTCKYLGFMFYNFVFVKNVRKYILLKNNYSYICKTIILIIVFDKNVTWTGCSVAQ